MRKSQGNAVRWFNKTEDCFFPRSFILRSNVQSFKILPSFNLAISLAISSQSITFTILFLFIYPFRKYTPLASIGAYLVHHKSIVLIFIETNAIKYLLHPAFMTRNINAFTHVLDIPARLFPICRLFPVTINDNHYLFLSVT